MLSKCHKNFTERACVVAVRQIIKNERTYYEDVLSFSRSHLMMYPYHLSDVVVKGLRVTPFQYYISILTDIMSAEKSYDSLPNFTAADCEFCFVLFFSVLHCDPVGSHSLSFSFFFHYFLHCTQYSLVPRPSSFSVS